MLEKVNKQTKWIFLGIISLVLVIGITSCATGIGAGDIVLSRTPAEVQTPVYVEAIDDETGESVRVKLNNGLPEVLSHNDSEREYLIWQEQQLRVAERWQANLEESAKWVGFTEALGKIGIQALDDQIKGLGPLAIAGAGLIGMFGIKRPGDSTKDQVAAQKAELEAKWIETLRQNKEDSYKAGYKTANETYKALLATLKANDIDISKFPESVSENQ